MKQWWFLFAFGLLAACKTPQPVTVSGQASRLVTDGKLWSSLYQQRSAEYKALCFQAYNLAHLRVEEALRQSSSRPRAIVTDIDETFLDNSPYAVHQALINKDYDGVSWTEWTKMGSADTLPGALGFFNYAASRQVEVFYITNRRENEKAGTLKNLQRFHFPYADEQHLILRKDVSSKEARRQQVAAGYDIILFLGDNLADFSALFDSRNSPDERDEIVARMSGEFGKKFIVLPNPNYGGWEEAIYNYNYSLSPAQKDSAIKANLKSY